ncbi:MAG: ATP-binding protein [Trebonia sp.]
MRDTPAGTTARNLPRTLRDNPLFSGLGDDQLSWAAATGALRDLGNGDVLIRDGEPTTHFYALLDGELVITKMIDGHEEVLTRHRAPAPDEPFRGGKPRAANYFTGEMQLLTDCVNVATITAGEHATVLAFTKDQFFELIARCPKIASVMLPVLAWRVHSQEVQARSQATIAALGTLAAGLAHELNNPASAITRAAGEVDAAARRLTSTASEWCAASDEDERRALSAAAAAIEATPRRGPAAAGLLAEDDDVFEWAAARGARDAARLADALTDLAITAPSLESLLSGIAAPRLAAALDHLSATLEVRDLCRDLREAGSRISALVASARTYANLDRATEQVFDVLEGIEATLAVLRHKMSGVTIVREYTDGLPRITGNPSELNEVWTNLIDNAIDAMDGQGTLTLFACHDAGCVTVKITDTGGGIPPEILPRVFEPFYTTKDVGSGTGLGLHLSHRIVTKSHGGSITARPRPGGTTMVVRLPAGDRSGRVSCAVPDAIS